MMMKTEKAHEIRMYYISLEKIVKAYVKYQEDYKQIYASEMSRLFTTIMLNTFSLVPNTLTLT
jgi:hypothetical protein